MLSIIVSTKDRCEALKALYESVKKNTRDFEFIVVDDDSKDSTRNWLASHYIKRKENNHSVPVAVAWNEGAELAEGEYLVFLNDDMLVTPGWADEMRKMYETKLLIGSLAFKVIDDQGNIQSRGHSFVGHQPYLPEEEVEIVDYSDHPFMTKKMWERMGGFTAHGHLYYEDADMGLKLQSRGFFTYYNPKAVLIHQTIGLRTGSTEDKKRRKHNEEVVQQQSKVSFFKVWENYLNSKSV
jgi:GT2 family glycosyltransferase